MSIQYADHKVVEVTHMVSPTTVGFKSHGNKGFQDLRTSAKQYNSLCQAIQRRIPNPVACPVNDDNITQWREALKITLVDLLSNAPEGTELSFPKDEKGSDMISFTLCNYSTQVDSFVDDRQVAKLASQILIAYPEQEIDLGMYKVPLREVKVRELLEKAKKWIDKAVDTEVVDGDAVSLKKVKEDRLLLLRSTFQDPWSIEGGSTLPINKDLLSYIKERHGMSDMNSIDETVRSNYRLAQELLSRPIGDSSSIWNKVFVDKSKILSTVGGPANCIAGEQIMIALDESETITDNIVFNFIHEVMHFASNKNIGDKAPKKTDEIFWSLSSAERLINAEHYAVAAELMNRGKNPSRIAFELMCWGKKYSKPTSHKPTSHKSTSPKPVSSIPVFSFEKARKKEIRNCGESCWKGGVNALVYLLNKKENIELLPEVTNLKSALQCQCPVSIENKALVCAIAEKMLADLRTLMEDTFTPAINVSIFTQPDPLTREKCIELLAEQDVVKKHCPDSAEACKWLQYLCDISIPEAHIDTTSVKEWVGATAPVVAPPVASITDSLGLDTDMLPVPIDDDFKSRGFWKCLFGCCECD